MEQKSFRILSERFILLTAICILFAGSASAQDPYEDIGISPAKDKIAIVRTKWDYKMFHEPGRDHLEVNYFLWAVDLKSGAVKVLAKFNNTDVGIVRPEWSSDGKWITFGTFSVGGHSPGTTARIWIVDSAGNDLQKIELPAPFNRFSSCFLSWDGENRIVIQGEAESVENGQWITTKKKFIFDCETKKIISAE
jgi:Tol biopolymer transport system component